MLGYFLCAFKSIIFLSPFFKINFILVTMIYIIVNGRVSCIVHSNTIPSTIVSDTLHQDYSTAPYPPPYFSSSPIPPCHCRHCRFSTEDQMQIKTMLFHLTHIWHISQSTKSASVSGDVRKKEPLHTFGQNID